MTAYLDPLRDEISRLRAELACTRTDRDTYRDAWEQAERELAAETRRHNLTLDTLRHRTESHGRLVRDRLACPHCKALPIEETPSE